MLKLSDLYLVRKETLATYSLEAGFFIAYLGSLNPWFLWPIGSLYVIPATCFILLAICIANTMKVPFFSKTDYLLPSIIYIFLSFYLLLVNKGNINAFIGNFFNIIVFTTLFMCNKQTLIKISDFLSKYMACLLAISIPFYFLYLFGYNLPSQNAQFGDGLYTYTNYYFFLIDDRALFIFPRFHSVFLEPGHLGTATILLLFSQCGRWHKWYNIILWIATLMTFSLAAYVLSIIILFLNLWMKGKNILKKLLITICAITSILAGSFIYNHGENLIHDLILIRLEMDEEGELSGDNRVAGWFEDEYDSYLQSSDILFGRDYDYSISGNSGYRLFIYENGLVGLFLIILLYSTFLIRAKEKKVMLSIALISILCFWVRGYPLWYNIFIPLYILSKQEFSKGITKQKKQNHECCLHT